jgi:hypothetical protein
MQIVHYIKAAHAGHLQIEQNQAVTVLEVQFAHLIWVGRRRNVGIAGCVQQCLERVRTGLLIVYDQDFGIQNIRCVNHLFSPVV